MTWLSYRERINKEEERLKIRVENIECKPKTIISMTEDTIKLKKSQENFHIKFKD